MDLLKQHQGGGPARADHLPLSQRGSGDGGGLGWVPAQRGTRERTWSWHRCPGEMLSLHFRTLSISEKACCINRAAQTGEADQPGQGSSATLGSRLAQPQGFPVCSGAQWCKFKSCPCNVIVLTSDLLSVSCTGKYQI